MGEEGDSMMSYAAVESDIRLESRNGSVSPGRVLREMATNAQIHGAPDMARLFNDVCNQTNRDSARYSELKRALQILMYSLHAAPLFGGPHMTLEDAVANALEVLEKQRPGDRKASSCEG